MVRTTSSGGSSPSFELKRALSSELFRKPKLYTPSPTIADVTSHSTYSSSLISPNVASGAPFIAKAFCQFSVCSVQGVLVPVWEFETRYTEPPLSLSFVT